MVYVNKNMYPGIKLNLINDPHCNCKQIEITTSDGKPLIESLENMYLPNYLEFGMMTLFTENLIPEIRFQMDMLGIQSIDEFPEDISSKKLVLSFTKFSNSLDQEVLRLIHRVCIEKLSSFGAGSECLLKQYIATIVIGNANVHIYKSLKKDSLYGAEVSFEFESDYPLVEIFMGEYHITRKDSEKLIKKLYENFKLIVPHAEFSIRKNSPKISFTTQKNCYFDSRDGYIIKSFNNIVRMMEYRAYYLREEFSDRKKYRICNGEEIEVSTHLAEYDENKYNISTCISCGAYSLYEVMHKYNSNINNKNIEEVYKNAFGIASYQRIEYHTMLEIGDIELITIELEKRIEKFIEDAMSIK